MLRRTATDKYIWCISLLILLCIIAIIAMRIVLHQQNRMTFG